MMWRALLQTFLAFLPALLFHVPARVQADPAVAGCIPGRAAWISGITLGASPEEVESKLGPPASRQIRQGEDDGGFYDEIMLAYPRIKVFVVRDVVDRVTTTHPESCTAGGICPGISREEVRESLAKVSAVPVASAPSTIVICPENGFLSDYYLLVHYTATGKVAQIELALDRP